MKTSLALTMFVSLCVISSTSAARRTNARRKTPTAAKKPAKKSGPAIRIEGSKNDNCSNPASRAAIKRGIRNLLEEIENGTTQPRSQTRSQPSPSSCLPRLSECSNGQSCCGRNLECVQKPNNSKWVCDLKRRGYKAFGNRRLQRELATAEEASITEAMNNTSIDNSIDVDDTAIIAAAQELIIDASGLNPMPSFIEDIIARRNGYSIDGANRKLRNCKKGRACARCLNPSSNKRWCDYYCFFQCGRRRRRRRHRRLRRRAASANAKATLAEVDYQNLLKILEPKVQRLRIRGRCDPSDIKLSLMFDL